MATINLGNIRFNWLGEYKSTTTYTKDDVVFFDGSSYIAKKTVQAISPENQDYWDLMVAGAGKAHVLGEQDLMPFRSSELPEGWYFRNGDNYLLDSPQGRALNKLSVNYKEDFRITIKVIEGKEYINIPTAFAQDGRGYFERPVDGIARQVGSVQGDAIRNIEGYLGSNQDITPTGAFQRISGGLKNSGTDKYASVVKFNASLVVPTASENRPLNIGMTPVIYLGV